MIKYDYHKEKVERPENFWLADDFGFSNQSPEEHGITFKRGEIRIGSYNGGKFYLDDEEARELAYGILKVLGDE